MLIQKVKTYKWQALASLLMTGLMVASSLLQPRYLQEVLDALLAGKYEAIYSIGAWLIGVAVVGLVAGGLNVVLAAYICLLYTSPSPRDPKTSRMPSSA